MHKLELKYNLGMSLIVFLLVGFLFILLGIIGSIPWYTKILSIILGLIFIYSSMTGLINIENDNSKLNDSQQKKEEN
ncbi:MAG: hypothetical protein ACFFG0_33940 [Candidatus Thorarchaeota archaeon]